MKRVTMFVRKYFGLWSWLRSRMSAEWTGLRQASRVWSEGFCRQQS